MKSVVRYGRWRAFDGRRLNRKIGPVRGASGSDGLTRTQAEREFRKMQEREELRPHRPLASRSMTVDDVATSLRERLELRGVSKPYRETCGHMQRIHVKPLIGERNASQGTRDDIEAFARMLLKRELSPQSVRNILGFLNSVFEHGIDRGWVADNPVQRAEKPRRRGTGVSPDLQFLTLSELEAVIRAIPDRVVIREPALTRRGRPGPAPPPSPDVLGPVLRVLTLAAALPGLRQSELLGLRWGDIDWVTQRIRVRHPFVRGEPSPDGKSELSTRRSVPLPSRLAKELDLWSRRTAYGG